MNESLIALKYEELTRYISARARRWQASESRLDDIVHNVMVRLLEENAEKEFTSAKALWGRAANITSEETAKTFADSLPLSGVGFQAHWTARKALMRADGDPHKAYYTQEGSSRVGRELLYLVAQGNALTDPTVLQSAETSSLSYEGDDSALSQIDEDNIRVAVSSLSDIEQQIVRMRLWMQMRNSDVAKELGMSTKEVKRTYERSLKRLRTILSKSITRFNDGDVV